MIQPHMHFPASRVYLVAAVLVSLMIFVFFIVAVPAHGA